MSPLAPRMLFASLALALALAAPALAQEKPEKAPRPQEDPPARQAPADGKGAPPTAAEQVREAAKGRTGFDSWPGRDGPSRDGIDLAALVERSKDTTWELRAAPGGPIATGRRLVDGGVSTVLIWIEETPAEAHETLLTWLAGCTRPLERTFDRYAPGDLAFVAKGGDESVVAFATSNVVAVLRAPGQGVIHVLPYAKVVEVLIHRSPALDGKRRRTAIEGASLEPRNRMPRDPWTALALVGAEGAIAREVTAEDGFVEDGPDGLLRVRSPEKGDARVTAHLLSPRGWRTSVSTSVLCPLAPK